MEVNFTMIGSRIAEIRNAQNCSQMRLAEITDLSISYISHIETAKKKPSLESIVKIVNALNVTVDEVLCGNQLSDPCIYQTDIELLLSDCSQSERQVLYRMLKASKDILRDSGWNTTNL